MEAEIVVKFLLLNSPQFFAFGTTRQDAMALIAGFANGTLEDVIHRQSDAGAFAVRVKEIAAVHTEPVPRQNVPPGVAGPVGRLGIGTSGMQR